jgi:Spore Coat Protein U domain
MRKFLLPLVAGALAAGAASAQAASSSANFNVSVTVAKNCTISATNIDFGTVTNLSGQVANGTITANCSTGAVYNMGLASTAVSLVGTTSSIPATLTFAADGVSQVGNGANQNYPVTAALPNTGMAPDNDTYTGSATVNINF